VAAVEQKTHKLAIKLIPIATLLDDDT